MIDYLSRLYASQIPPEMSRNGMAVSRIPSVIFFARSTISAVVMSVVLLNNVIQG